MMALLAFAVFFLIVLALTFVCIFVQENKKITTRVVNECHYDDPEVGSYVLSRRWTVAR